VPVAEWLSTKLLSPLARANVPSSQTLSQRSLKSKSD
jgi:hypothetical protein